MTENVPLIAGQNSNQGPQPIEIPPVPTGGGHSAEGDAPDAHSIVSGGNVSQDQAMFHRSTVKRNGAKDNTSNEDTAAAAAAAEEEEQTKLLRDREEQADETSTSKSDKDK